MKIHTDEHGKPYVAKEHEALQAKIRELEESLRSEKEHSNAMATDICQLQDSLGCPCEMTNSDGSIRDCQLAAMERIRDLIAHEGELGDMTIERDKLRSELSKREKDVEVLRACLEKLADGNHPGTSINKGCAAMVIIEYSLSQTSPAVETKAGE